MNRQITSLLLLCFALQSCLETDKAINLILLDSPARANSEEPSLTTGADGKVYMSWLEKDEKQATLFYSQLADDKWSPPVKIADGKDWFVNWADHPMMAINKSGDMIAHYLQKSDSGTYTYDVKIVTKKSDVQQWSESIKLHSDTVNAEHGFVSMKPMKNDNFLISWLDGRNTISSGHGHGEGSMTIRAAIFNPDGKKLEEWELDNRVCDCCGTANGISEKGAVVVYRDRTENEIRDMSIVRYVNNQWTEPTPVFNDNWKIAGCPVNGPSLSTFTNTLVIGWFTAADEKPKVNLIFSSNSGESFDQPVQVDLGNPLGRVKVELLDTKTAFISWMEGDQIVAAKVDISGQISQRYSLASSSTDRSSGFPQITASKDNIIVAWTDTESKKVKTGILNL